jgi:hypothetical protein
MKALLAKSQLIDVQRLTAFGPRFLDESLKFGARALVSDDFFPTLVALCKLTQLIKHSATLSITEFWQLFDDFSCAGKGNYIPYGWFISLLVFTRCLVRKNCRNSILFCSGFAPVAAVHHRRISHRQPYKPLTMYKTSGCSGGL